MALVERGMDEVLLDEHRVIRAERGRLLLEVLRDRSSLDDDHLLLAWVSVEVVAAARLQRHIHHHQLLCARLGIRAPADVAPIKLLVLDVGLLDELAHVSSPSVVVSQTAILLKRRMFSVIAASVGRRSMLEAPKKPTTPVARLNT